MKRLFVYGSLRKGQRAHRTLEIRHAHSLGEVRVPGYDLFSLGWYPGIKPNPENKAGVVGELYEFPDHLWDELIETLDYYEGYFPRDEEHSLFVRKEIEINGEPTSVYEYNGKMQDWTALVPSGDWLDHNVKVVEGRMVSA